MREMVRLTANVHGLVIGVGFRAFTRATAQRIGGLVGWARNTPDGRVEVVVEGPRESCQRLLDYLRGGGTPGRVDTVTESWSDPSGDLHGFTIR